MKLVSYIFLCFASIVCVATAHAAAIGEVERTDRFGYALSVAYLSVDDSDGDTEGEWEVLPLNFIYTNQWLGGFRYWVEGFYQETTLDASTNDVGQDVERYGLRLALQHRATMIEAIQLFGGIGLVLSKDDFTKRHTVDNDGFLKQSYSDQTDNNVGFQVDVMSEWEINRRWDIAARALYEVPITNGVEEFSVSLVLLYTRP